MSIYIFLSFLFLLLLVNRHNDIYYHYKHIIITIVILILFIVCVFRSLSVGTDYREYYWMFTEPYQEFVSNFVIPGYVESGFAHLVNFAQRENNFLIMSVIVFIIDIFAIHLLGKRFRVNSFSLISFFVLTGLYFQMFTALRQMIAIGLVCIGMCFLFSFNKNRLLGVILFILFVLLASDFHKTAIFAFIFIILPKIRYSKNTVVISGILTTFLFITGIAQDIAAFIIARVPYYSLKYQDSIDMSNHGSPLVLLIESIPIMIQFIFLYKFISLNNVKDVKGRFILSGYLLYLILLSGLDNNSVRRLQLYTLIFPILFSCMFIDRGYLCKYKFKLKDKMAHSKGISSYIYIAFWILLYFGKLLITDRFHIVPYSFINLFIIHR